MTKKTIELLQKFVTDNPDIERIEAIFPTINGIYRGKWVPPKDIAKLANGTMRLPVSTYALDSWGIDVEASGLGIVNGDPDGIGYAIPKTLSRMSWTSKPAAQVIMQMDMRDKDNTPCPYDPRQQLANMQKRFEMRGLKAVIATELEFYLVKPRTKQYSNLEPFLTTANGNLNNLDHMIEFEGVLSDIRSACDEQNVLADVMIAEAGMCQFEINFKHVDDPLRAGDQAMLFKRIVKGCARKYGMEATFMAKPFGEDLGSGMHAHVSVLDKDGNNIFEQDGQNGKPSANLLHAVGGLLHSMRELQAIFAPNLNSYRRFQPGSFAPNQITWGLDHRGAAVRLPETSGPAARLEHRISGADANPYLVLCAILGGILHGLDNKLDPGNPIEEKSPDQAELLHQNWNQAVDSFAQSKLVSEIFGKEFQQVYTHLRHHEISQLAKQISDIELDLYMSGA